MQTFNRLCTKQSSFLIKTPLLLKPNRPSDVDNLRKISIRCSIPNKSIKDKVRSYVAIKLVVQYLQKIRSSIYGVNNLSSVNIEQLGYYQLVLKSIH